MNVEVNEKHNGVATANIMGTYIGTSCYVIQSLKITGSGYMMFLKPNNKIQHTMHVIPR